jgi:hypothetical protein
MIIVAQTPQNNTSATSGGRAGADTRTDTNAMYFGMFESRAQHHRPESPAQRMCRNWPPSREELVRVLLEYIRVASRALSEVERLCGDRLTNEQLGAVGQFSARVKQLEDSIGGSSGGSTPRVVELLEHAIGEMGGLSAIYTDISFLLVLEAVPGEPPDAYSERIRLHGTISHSLRNIAALMATLADVVGSAECFRAVIGQVARGQVRIDLERVAKSAVADSAQTRQ